MVTVTRSVNGRNGHLNNGHHRRFDPSATTKKYSSGDDQLLRELERLWNSRNEKDLEVRRRMGEALNKAVGEPTRRETYGAKVIAKAAKRLDLTKGELSRLRWFAFHYPEHKMLRDARNWSAVKKLLPKLAPKKKSRKAKGSTTEKNVSRFVRKTTSSLRSATATLRRLSKCPAGKQRDGLLDTLREFVKAAKSCLRVRLTMER